MARRRSSERAKAVTRIEDDVDKCLAVVRLGQPMGEGHFGAIARRAEHFDGAAYVARPHHEVEILGVPDHAGVGAQAEGAAHQEGNTMRVEEAHRFAIKVIGREIG